MDEMISSIVDKERDYHRNFSKLKIQEVLFILKGVKDSGYGIEGAIETAEKTEQLITSDNPDEREKAVENVENILKFIVESFRLFPINARNQYKYFKNFLKTLGNGWSK